MYLRCFLLFPLLISCKKKETMTSRVEDVGQPPHGYCCSSHVSTNVMSATNPVHAGMSCEEWDGA